MWERVLFIGAAVFLVGWGVCWAVKDMSRQNKEENARYERQRQDPNTPRLVGEHGLMHGTDIQVWQIRKHIYIKDVSRKAKKELSHAESCPCLTH